MKKELLIGCGSNHSKQMGVEGEPFWSSLTTLDMNADHSPDVVHDLHSIPLPFEENSFDEIHAYNVLEHVGRQGDWKFFFDQWNDFHRLLKPGGFLFAIAPMWNSVWAFADPSHTRVLPLQSLVFLAQKEYQKQVGNSPMTDFRFCYHGDFEILSACEYDGDNARFVLRAIK